MRELRIRGRGGQGAVIASKLQASTFFREGNDEQIAKFQPHFGTRWKLLERRVEHGS